MSNTDDVGDSAVRIAIGRVLACGNDEARASALALVANFGEPSRVEEVQAELQRIRRVMES